MIIKKHIASVQTSGHTKRIIPILHGSGVHDSRLSKRSESNHNGNTVNGIIDNFVPVKDFDGISPSFRPNF